MGSLIFNNSVVIVVQRGVLLCFKTLLFTTWEYCTHNNDLMMQHSSYGGNITSVSRSSLYDVVNLPSMIKYAGVSSKTGKGRK